MGNRLPKHVHRNLDYADRRSPLPLSERWAGLLAIGFVQSLPSFGMLLIGTLLLTLAFAPINQLYLAWIGLVPWLLVLRKTRSAITAFLWSWLAGLLFFTANMWWLWGVTGPGMVALMGLLGLYWAVPGAIWRGVGLFAMPATQKLPSSSPPSTLHPRSSLLAILAFALLWTGFEWMRGTWPLQGLPWLYLGHTQSPVLAMCQIADITGVYGVTFWGAALNLVIALAVVHRQQLRALAPSFAAIASLTVLLAVYGIWRIGQSAHTTSPGPTVLVVQPNFPQSNTGEKGATFDEMVDFHVRTTRNALALRPDVDLVVWSETMLPDLNVDGRQNYPPGEFRQYMEDQIAGISAMCAKHGVGLLAGATYSTDFRTKPQYRYPIPADRRNAAYLFDRNGRLTDQRYDKIHIVPFGEYLPFQSSFPPLYRLFVSLSPYGEEYTLRPGSEDAITRFTLENSTNAYAASPSPGTPGEGRGGGSSDSARPTTKTAPSPTLPRSTEGGGEGASPESTAYRFVTPICFEDIDPALVAKMFRGSDGTKAADMIINITNDGWFQFNEMPQHLQAALFRSIENRVPTARSVNTGISGFIDSTGRLHDLIPAGTEGVSQSRLQVDSRYTFYTRHGDLFGIGCAIAAALLAGWGSVRWWVSRRSSRSSVLGT